MPHYDYNCEECGIFEEYHSINIDLDKCPTCGSMVEKILSSGGGIILKGREMNTYNDVKLAKYWRDKDGNRHKVKSSDGHSKA